MPLNEFLLSRFASNCKFGPKMDDIRRRFRIASNIYINILLILTATSHDIFTWLFTSTPTRFLFTTICWTFMIISILFLRRGRDNIARNITVTYMHVLHLIGSYSGKIPLSMFISLMRVPSVCLLLGFQTRTTIFHVGLCVVQYFICLHQANRTFKVTLNDEQANQIFSMMITGFLSLNYVILTSFTQKYIDDNAWRLANENFQKSEDITKEMVQMAENKNAYIVPLSQEIKSVFNSMRENIEEISQKIKIADSHGILETIKLSNEVLVDIVNNLLDASKPCSNRSVHYKASSLTDVVKKTLAAYSSALRKKNITAQAYIDKSIPRQLWLDSPLLSQIMLNIVSKIVDVSSPETELEVYSTWHSETSDLATLLKPIKELSPENSSREQETQQNELTGSDYNNSSVYAPFECDQQETKQRIKKLEALKFPDTRSLKDLLSPTERSSKVQNWNIHPEQNLLNTNDELQRLLSSSHLSFHSFKYFTKGFLKVQISNSKCQMDAESLKQLIKATSKESHDTESALSKDDLGLWVSRQFCRKMKGDITVHGRPGEELSFIFYIPLDNTRIIKSEGTISLQRRSKVTALVVDDYAFNRDLHKLLLEKQEVEVTLANDGLEALNTYTKRGGCDYFDFILMDVRMPVMDGFTSAKKIREWERDSGKQEVDICFVSGDYFNADQVKADLNTKEDPTATLNLQFMRKPLDIQALKTTVAKYKQF